MTYYSMHSNPSQTSDVTRVTHLHFQRQPLLFFSQLNIHNLPLPIVSDQSGTNRLGSFGKIITRKCAERYGVIAMGKLDMWRSSPDSKMFLYSQLKNTFLYERYLDADCPFKTSLTKFRLSAHHHLPIERGRYFKPKLPRDLRSSTLQIL